MLLDDEDTPELALEVEGSAGSATNKPHRFNVAMRSRSAALSLPALRTRRCFVRRLLRCAAFAACIILFVTSARRLASWISSSISILGRLPFLGRPNGFGAGAETTAVVSVGSSGMPEAVVSLPIYGSEKLGRREG